MMTARLGFNEIIKRGVLAGTAGGIAEIVWVSLYAAATGGNAAVLARGVTTAAGVTALLPVAPIATGVAVHMTFAVMLGVALVWLWQAGAWRDTINQYAFMLAALAGVWAINFFVILPVIDASFVHLVPYSVSLVSKLLFGLAAAETLRRSAASQETMLQARQ
jgi:hypothetical protein